MIYIGVDPGKNGAYALIDDTGARGYPWDDARFIEDMRVIVNRMDDTAIAAVEKVGAMPGNGSVSMFNFGQSYGFILGALRALGIPFQIVPPRKWKGEFGLNSEKAKSIEVCHRLFPDVSLRRTDKCRTDSDGLAEALLICEWGRRNL